MKMRVILAAVVAVGLALAGSPARSAGSESVPVQVIKGFVTARTRASLTVLSGQTTVWVSMDAFARIKGQRARWDQIAVNDVVRAEGRMIGTHRLRAREIDVVLAAGTLVVGPPAAPALSGIWAWLAKGGPVFSLP